MTVSKGWGESLTELQQEIHDTAVSKGFWEDGDDQYVIGTKLALIHSEVTETLEAIRKEKGPDEIADECADIVIRLLDLYQVMQNKGLVRISLADAIIGKMDTNRRRDHKHGNAF